MSTYDALVARKAQLQITLKRLDPMLGNGQEIFVSPAPAYRDSWVAPEDPHYEQLVRVLCDWREDCERQLAEIEEKLAAVEQLLST